MRKMLPERLPLSRAFTGLTLIATLVLFGTLLALVLGGTRILVERNQQVEMRNQVRTLAGMLNTFIADRMLLLEDYAAFPLMTQAVMQPRQHLANISDFMASLSLLGRKYPLALLDFEGTVIHSTSALVLPEPDEAWVLALLADKRQRQAGYIRAAEESSVRLAVPVVYNGHSEGILLCQIPLNDLDRMYDFRENLVGARLELLIKGEKLAAFGPQVEGPVTELEDADLGLTLRYTADAEVARGDLLKLLLAAFALLTLILLTTLAVVIYTGRRFLIGPLLQLRDFGAALAESEERREPLRFCIEELDQLSGDLVEMTQKIYSRDAANEEKTRFIANMSHELRTPINGIVGLTALLRKTDLNGEQARRVAMIEHAAEVLLELVGDVLDLSRIESGRLELESAPLAIRELVRLVVDSQQETEGAARLRVTWRVDERLPEYLEGDEGRLRQVLNNLAGNAIKFTENGRVEVEAALIGREEERRLVRFSVRDTGIGIPPEKQESIFHAFVQADTSTTRRYGGTGLGLSISRRLVEMMGGSLELLSAPGEGSEFSFAVPLGTVTADDVAPPEKPQEGARRSLRVLLVEDNELNQLVARDLLEQEGHRVEVAADGRIGVEAAMRGDFDVILMDVQMPVMDGIEATRAIREREGNGKHVPIIAFTAHAAVGDSERFTDAGMDGYLSKPLRTEQLFAMIDRAGNEWHRGKSTGESEGILDSEAWDRLERMAARGQFSIERYIGIFLHDAPQRLANLRQALAERDGESLEREAHTIKGGAREFGAVEMVALCQQLEDMGRTGEFDGATRLLEQVEMACGHLTTELERRMTGQGDR